MRKHISKYERAWLLVTSTGTFLLMVGQLILEGHV